MTDSTASSTPSVSGAPRKGAPQGFWVVWSTVALDLIGFGIVIPILPLYVEDFGVGPATVGALVAVYSLAQGIMAPVMGRVSDRVGRKPVLLVSLVGSAIGSLLTGLAGSVAVLFAARILDGASGASISVAQAAVTDLAEPEDRPRLLGLLGAAIGLGFVLGPALGALGALVSTRTPFYLAAGLALLNAGAAAYRLPETHPPGSARVVDELEPVDVPGVRKAVAPLLIVAFLGTSAFSGFEATFSLLADRRFGLSPSGVAVVFVAIGLVLSMVQGGLVGPTTKRIGVSRTLLFGLATVAAGLVLLAVEGGWATTIPALGLLVVGQGLASPALSVRVGDVAGRARRGVVYGWQQASSAGARAVGPLLAGALFEWSGPSSTYLVGGGLMAAALVVALPNERANEG
ncbi:MAG: MFS transporter [Actinomycetia bacterium]|nr:MFS transporter [Actinomycetes bacterium]